MHKILKWVYIIFIHPNTITWFSAWMCFSMCFAYITMKWNAFCTNPDLRRFDLHVMWSCVNGIRNEFIWFWIVLSFIHYVWKIAADTKYYQKYIISAKFCTSNSLPKHTSYSLLNDFWFINNVANACTFICLNQFDKMSHQSKRYIMCFRNGVE